MGVLVPLKTKAEEEMAAKVSQSAELANVVSRMLKAKGCKVMMSGVQGEQAFLIVQAERPMHSVALGHLHFDLAPTPGRFIGQCRTLLLQCDVLWLIRPDATDPRGLH